MIYAANWKMNMGPAGAEAFLKKFKALLQPGEKSSFIFFPPALVSFLFEKEDFHWGGQNIFFQKSGAYTGENSPEALYAMGARFCLIGHSERRLVFQESLQDIEKKFHLLLSLNIAPVVCAGETAEMKNQKDRVLKKQLGFLKNFNPNFIGNLQGPPGFEKAPFIIAYEPVWAIGSGKTPSPEEVGETHERIKSLLPSDDIPVLYGGSLTPKNAAAFSKAPFTDGFLVGGASLSPESFYSVFQQTRPHGSARQTT